MGAFTTGYYMVDGVKSYYDADTNTWYHVGAQGQRTVFALDTWIGAGWTEPIVSPGDTVEMTYGFGYIGPAGNVTIYAAAGIKQTLLGIDSMNEVVVQNPITVAVLANVTNVPVFYNNNKVRFTIPSDSRYYNLDWCVYFKIGSLLSPIYTAAFYVLGSGTYSNLAITNVTKV
jgi:hypothetical protein